METFKKGFQKGKKSAKIKKIVSMLENAKTEEEIKNVEEYMNKNGISTDDVGEWIANNS